MSMHHVNDFESVELLSPSAAAKLLPETSAATLQRWARQGKLPVVKMPSGRLYFSRAVIQALLDPVVLSEDVRSEVTETNDVPLPGLGVV